MSSTRNHSRRHSRSSTPRRRQPVWPWILVVLLALAAVYFSLRRPEGPPRIGIVAGHWQNDSGATCPNGLREVDITLPIAKRIVELLKAQGHEAEVLPEYGERLQGYRAAALVSLHADSCIPGLSGFKIAGTSRAPAAVEAVSLVENLSRSYAQATGLKFHANTITPDMTNYHAFSKIDPRTPAAIVELGFMSDDAPLLTTQQDRVAQGIAGGILAFLNARNQATPTPTPRR